MNERTKNPERLTQVSCGKRNTGPALLTPANLIGVDVGTTDARCREN